MSLFFSSVVFFLLLVSYNNTTKTLESVAYLGLNKNIVEEYFQKEEIPFRNISLEKALFIEEERSFLISVDSGFVYQARTTCNQEYDNGECVNILYDIFSQEIQPFVNKNGSSLGILKKREDNYLFFEWNRSMVEECMEGAEIITNIITFDTKKSFSKYEKFENINLACGTEDIPSAWEKSYSVKYFSENIFFTKKTSLDDNKEIDEKTFLQNIEQL